MATATSPLPPHARRDAPWTHCGDPRSPDFGEVFANPAANGALALSFDREGRRHAVTLFCGVELGGEIVIHGRRFSVVHPTVAL
jgi:hypothetical protein